VAMQAARVETVALLADIPAVREADRVAAMLAATVAALVAAASAVAVAMRAASAAAADMAAALAAVVDMAVAAAIGKAAPVLSQRVKGDRAFSVRFLYAAVISPAFRPPFPTFASGLT
jgi:hypothetical protein